jgi:hypothetical protein
MSPDFYCEFCDVCDYAPHDNPAYCRDQLKTERVQLEGMLRNQTERASKFRLTLETVADHIESEAGNIEYECLGLIRGVLDDDFRLVPATIKQRGRT